MTNEGTSTAVPAPEGRKHIEAADHLVAADVTGSGDAWETTAEAQPEGRAHIGMHEHADDFVTEGGKEGFVSTADARYLGESGPEKYSGHKVHYRNRDHFAFGEGVSTSKVDDAFGKAEWSQVDGAIGHRRYVGAGHVDHMVTEGTSDVVTKTGAERELKTGKRRVVPDHMLNEGISSTDNEIKGKRHIPVTDHLTQYMTANNDSMLHVGVSNPQNSISGTGEGRRHIEVVDHMITEGTSSGIEHFGGKRHIPVPDHLGFFAGGPAQTVPSVTKDDVAAALRQEGVSIIEPARWAAVDIAMKGRYWAMSTIAPRGLTLSREGSGAKEIARTMAQMPTQELMHFGCKVTSQPGSLPTGESGTAARYSMRNVYPKMHVQGGMHPTWRDTVGDSLKDASAYPPTPHVVHHPNTSDESRPTIESPHGIKTFSKPDHMLNDGISSVVRDERGIKTFAVRDHMLNEGTAFDDPARGGKIRTFDKPDHILNNVEFTSVKADATIGPKYPQAMADSPEGQWQDFAENLTGGRPLRTTLAASEEHDRLQGDLRSVPNTRGKGFGPRHIEAPSHMANQGTSNAPAGPSGGRRYIGCRDDLKLQIG
jgi:hypothetical protein